MLLNKNRDLYSDENHYQHFNLDLPMKNTILKNMSRTLMHVMMVLDLDCLLEGKIEQLNFTIVCPTTLEMKEMKKSQIKCVGEKIRSYCKSSE
jgi:hypothetical protein